jgi:protein-L-isoaspartate(D-aspartate) O-methyltransferase
MKRRTYEAFEAAPRAAFLPDEIADLAQLDRPLPIGFEQTNSQPSTVLRMLKWLNVQEGQNVLDVGSGSGWTSSLLSFLVGDQGHVTAVERLPELVYMGLRNCERAGFRSIEFHQARETYGWPDNAPYERILVSARAEELPPELIEQLAVGGRLVIPIHDSIYELQKRFQKKMRVRQHPGFRFVPLLPVGEQQG